MFAFAFTDTDVPAPLDPAVLALAEDFPAPPVYDSDPKQDEKDAKGSRSGLRANLPFSSGKKKDGDDDGGERKYPKWFKLGPSEFRSQSHTAVHILMHNIQSRCFDREEGRACTIISRACTLGSLYTVLHHAPLTAPTPPSTGTPPRG